MMQFLLILALFQFPDPGQYPGDTTAYISPLASYSKQWNDPKYAVCNTASGANYMTDTEKQVIYILNLVRMNPTLFCETVLKVYPSSNEQMEHYSNSGYFKSLINTLATMQSANILLPDSLCFVSARCHAIYSGENNYAGHDRSDLCKQQQHYMGECCDYGFNTALDIVLDLLIDEDVTDLGHREICLSASYDKLGVSIQPHTGYQYNAVLDFY